MFYSTQLKENRIVHSYLNLFKKGILVSSNFQSYFKLLISRINLLYSLYQYNFVLLFTSQAYVILKTCHCLSTHCYKYSLHFNFPFLIPMSNSFYDSMGLSSTAQDGYKISHPAGTCNSPCTNSLQKPLQIIAQRKKAYAQMQFEIPI